MSVGLLYLICIATFIVMLEMKILTQISFLHLNSDEKIQLHKQNGCYVV